ncbi:lysophospholipid acyltransferase family protein [Spirochaeta isovalerica]|uniref:1-acyl-sn-glycerol-3-phosphate acyltransferase n=1 Tax=Spirochaeta isovalerica TaxID=150 RepID=A0A841RCY7_9SPIO|nr:lysophospholipid acyltransferase family protein [Spirochaeta isovalerica]MBB6481875.1 1-acyl-sn-glycerol-3-phosphate acyltransferase [Spirochaeta isovalerica]
MSEDYTKDYRESLLYKFLRSLVKNVVMPYYRVSWVNKEAVDKLEKPYLVLPNHSGFFDPFFLNAPVKEKFHYVVSDTQFRSPLMRFLLGQTGAIPITKNTNDLKSVKKMTDASRAGRVVGIFPEGLRNWDGETLPLIESTAKLVRMLNVPVVVPLLEGAYLMDPRWGTSLRRGKVVITYKILFDGQRPGRMKISEISSALKEALDHNEFTSETLKGVKFKSRKRAENIEQIVYLCPECHSISSFKSKGNDFSCSKCGYSVHYTEEGHFRALKGKDHFDNMAEWNKWQKGEAVKILQKDHGEEPIFSDCNLIHSMPDEKGAFRKKGKGCLYFYKDKIEYRDESGYLFIYKLEGISGMNVQLHERLEFYYEKELHRFHSKKRVFSARKVNDFYELSMDL